MKRIHPALICLCFTTPKTKRETLSCDMFKSVARGTVFLLRCDSLLRVATHYNLPMTGINLNQPLADKTQAQLNHCNLDTKKNIIYTFFILCPAASEKKSIPNCSSARLPGASLPFGGI